MHTPDQVQLAQLASKFRIPAFSLSMQEIERLVNHASPDIVAICQLIDNTPALSHELLATINSPYFCREVQLNEIKALTDKYGLSALCSYCTALLLGDNFKQDTNKLVVELWQDAVDIANAMVFLGEKVRQAIPSSLLFTIGVFQGSGMALLARHYEDYADVLSQALNNRDNSVRAEQQHYNIDHTVLAYAVATQWQLPENIGQLILHHHSINYFDTASHSHYQLAFCVLKAAEHMVYQAKYERPSPDWQEFKHTVLLMLGISELNFESIFTEYFNINH
ncbi:HDOD domain-containing protein [Thalassotalea fusca]